MGAGRSQARGRQLPLPRPPAQESLWGAQEVTPAGLENQPWPAVAALGLKGRPGLRAYTGGGGWVLLREEAGNTGPGLTPQLLPAGPQLGPPEGAHHGDLPVH